MGRIVFFFLCINLCLKKRSPLVPIPAVRKGVFWANFVVGDDVTSLRTMESMDLVFWRTMETIGQYIDQRGRGRPRPEGGVADLDP